MLGTGTFLVNKDRSSSAYLLETDTKKILIDCGPGTLMRLSQLGVGLQDIDYVFITHFHADHTGDLFPLFMNYRLNAFFSGGDTMKFPEVIGPKGIGKFMLKSSKLFELPAVEGWEKIKFTEAQRSQTVGDITVEAFKVKHIAFNLAAKSYAYRFTVGGKIIVFSGDSALCPGIRSACKNADLFFCDASYAKGGGNDAHMDTHEIGTISRKGKVRKVILSHFYPQTDNIDLVSEVKEEFSGEVIRGKDSMVLPL